MTSNRRKKDVQDKQVPASKKAGKPLMMLKTRLRKIFHYFVIISLFLVGLLVWTGLSYHTRAKPEAAKRIYGNGVFISKAANLRTEKGDGILEWKKRKELERLIGVQISSLRSGTARHQEKNVEYKQKSPATDNDIRSKQNIADVINEMIRFRKTLSVSKNNFPYKQEVFRYRQNSHATNEDHQEGFPYKQMGAVPPNIEKTWRNVRPSRCKGCFHTDFPVLTDQPKLCQAEDNTTIDIIFLITTAPENSERRDAIRKTWATVTRNNTANLRHVFMLGTTPDPSLRRAVEEEADHYHDLVVTGFRDSYRNLTYKTITALRWVTTRCQKARHFLKIDDDVWISALFLLSQATSNSHFLQRGLMGPVCYSHAVVLRDEAFKWYVPWHLYPASHYPPYCIGAAYLGSLNTARQVVDVSVDVPFFFVEDVYVGLCLKRAGFTVKPLPEVEVYFEHDQVQISSRGVYIDVSSAAFLELWANQTESNRMKNIQIKNIPLSQN